MNSDLLPSMPIAIFDIHLVCNQTCSYCVSGSSPTKDFGPIVDKDILKKIETFFKTHGPFNVLFTGGEPLITPGISSIFEMLIRHGHLVSLQSNLKRGAEPFMQVVPPERSGWILSTFHSVELKRFPTFLKHVMMLKEKGYPTITKLVLDDLMLTELETIYAALTENGIGVILSPLLYFPPNDLAFPKQYTSEEWALIAPRINLLSSWIFFAGGFKSRGTQCYAGSRIFYIRAFNGSIGGCGHSFPRDKGDLYANKLSPSRGPIRCGLEQCICDFHHYTGIIPKLDDSQQFNAFLRGQRESVPFSSYLAWIRQAGVEPMLDLRSVLGETEEEAVESGRVSEPEHSEAASGTIVSRLLRSIRL